MDKERRNTDVDPSRASQASEGSASIMGMPVRIVLSTIFATVFLLVIAELFLGWIFGPAEISFLVLIILVIMTGGANFLARRRRHNSDARH